jgi:uncharacterized hydrophobic protein (TIGR00271 family)
MIDLIDEIIMKTDLITNIKMSVQTIWLKFKKSLRLLTPRGVNSKEIHQLHQELSMDASWNSNYIACTISACLIATFGLISNSTAVIIGAMLVAPLMLPLRALAFGALEGDFLLFKKATISLIGATILALFLSYFTGIIVGIPEYGSELLARTQPNLVDLGIALTAGGISAFAKIRKGISDALAGTAIAVALMPPLSVVGLSLSQGMFEFAQGSFLLYLTNLLGITLACMIIFILAGYTEVSHALGWTLGLTGLLILPLGLSFAKLVIQTQLEQTLRETLLNKTVTLGQRPITLTNIKMNWNSNPPLATLNVQTQEKITPTQVRLVQEFISQQMERPFQLRFLVAQIDIIEPEILPPK